LGFLFASFPFVKPCETCAIASGYGQPRLALAGIDLVPGDSQIQAPHPLPGNAWSDR